MLHGLQDTIHRINCLTEEIDSLYHQAALKLGVSDSALFVLYMIHLNGERCALYDIYKQSGISKQTINSSVRRLEQAGYLTLKPGKGRDMHIFLTEAGKQLVSEKIALVIERENAAFFALSDAEQKELLQLSEKYFSNLQEQLRQLL